MHKRCLENLEVGVEKYETMIMPILLQKLPESIRKNVISRSLRSSNCYTMDNFLVLLSHEIDVLEECKEIGAIDRCSQSDDAKRELVTFREGSATVLPTLISKPTSKKNRICNKFCIYCDSHEHYSSDCSVVKSVHSRVEFLKADNRCFSCLRKFHVTKACKNKRKCPQCAKFHHITFVLNRKILLKAMFWKIRKFRPCLCTCKVIKRLYYLQRKP